MPLPEAPGTYRYQLSKRQIVVLLFEAGPPTRDELERLAEYLQLHLTVVKPESEPGEPAG